MIAIPVDLSYLSQARVSQFFGDVAYFALYDDRGEWHCTLPNTARGSGKGLSRFLADAGVDTVVFRHLGDKLYGWLRHQGISAFALGDPDTAIGDAVRAVRERRLERADDATIGRLLHPAGPGNGYHCELHD
ncbi:NifB/NifX family molybdenum-iron cluster-binding protein [Motiliproteus sediminis]|uniref:NifB/NifX family molybdenum-iron cluster-binding protein n=1 Tax=Motiliproteus sediminis TaxID=1468178 RepID=UPI001AF028CE|nr:NifB/NifX family molybdenum-iron cluster-binding protein [Motiliproteus sediminis]